MRYCLALDLQHDPALIAEYEGWHREVWPGIRKSIVDGGIEGMEIYRLENRLFMIMETGEGFQPLRKRGDGCGQSGGATLGRADVEIPGGDTGRKAGREMAIDGEDLFND
jgi:hypothetical protein